MLSCVAFMAKFSLKGGIDALLETLRDHELFVVYGAVKALVPVSQDGQ